MFHPFPHRGRPTDSAGQARSVRAAFVCNLTEGLLMFAGQTPQNIYHCSMLPCQKLVSIESYQKQQRGVLVPQKQTRTHALQGSRAILMRDPWFQPRSVRRIWYRSGTLETIVKKSAEAFLRWAVRNMEAIRHARTDIDS